MNIVGQIDIALICLYAFWIFFFGLIIYLQRETMREGYPMESETSGEPGYFGPFSLPSPKTFRLPHGHGEVTVPNPEKDAAEITSRNLAMRRTENWGGSPYEPTGDPMVDGVGPAAWAQRADHPELTVEGEPKLQPMRHLKGWGVAEGDPDPTGFTVTGCDGAVAGTVKDLWIDSSESLIRYLEVDAGGKIALCPMNCAKVDKAAQTIAVDSITAEQFARVPSIARATQITMLEEERVMAYFAGGKLYATPDRLEPLL